MSQPYHIAYYLADDGREITQQISSASPFMKRLCHLLADPKIHVTQLKMGNRRARLMWSQTQELE